MRASLIGCAALAFTVGVWWGGEERASAQSNIITTVAGGGSGEGVPAAAAYLRFLEDTLGLPIVILSTGPRREETLVRGDSALARELRALIAGDAPRAAL